MLSRPAVLSTDESVRGWQEVSHIHCPEIRDDSCHLAHIRIPLPRDDQHPGESRMSGSAHTPVRSHGAGQVSVLTIKRWVVLHQYSGSENVICKRALETGSTYG